MVLNPEMSAGRPVIPSAARRRVTRGGRCAVATVPSDLQPKIGELILITGSPADEA